MDDKANMVYIMPVLPNLGSEEGIGFLLFVYNGPFELKNDGARI